MLTADDVLQRYRDEELPEFADLPLVDVNEVGQFGNQPIHVAATRNAIDEVRALLQGGADVNAVGELGHQAIHEAIRHQNLDMVKLLLEAGAKLDHLNDFGVTPYDLALEADDQPIIDLLEKHIQAPQN